MELQLKKCASSSYLDAKGNIPADAAHFPAGLMPETNGI